MTRIEDFYIWVEQRAKLYPNKTFATVRLGFNRLLYSFEHQIFDFFTVNADVFIKNRSSLHHKVEVLLNIVVKSDFESGLFFDAIQLFYELKEWRVKADYKEVDTNFTKHLSKYEDYVNRYEDMIVLFEKTFSDDEAVKEISKIVKQANQYNNIKFI